MTAPGRSSSETIISRMAWYARSASEPVARPGGWSSPTLPLSAATEIHYSYLSSFPSAPGRNERARVTTRPMPSSLEIAQAASLRPIDELAADLGLLPDEIDLYGKFKG